MSIEQLAAVAVVETVFVVFVTVDETAKGEVELVQFDWLIIECSSPLVVPILDSLECFSSK